MLHFQNTFSVSDLINGFLLIIAVIGIFFTYSQIRQSYKTQKATFLKDLYLMKYGNPQLAEAFYKIEYSKFVYDEHFHGSKEEAIIDYLLSFADLVCDLYDQAILTEHEMDFFKYEFVRIYQNDNVKRYLEFLTKFYKANKIDIGPSHRFVKYCKSINA